MGRESTAVARRPLSSRVTVSARAASPSVQPDGVIDPVEVLQALLRFDTRNPPGNERACLEYVAGLLETLGVEHRFLARDTARPNLIARLRGRADAPPVLLYGHV